MEIVLPELYLKVIIDFIGFMLSFQQTGSL